MPSDLNRTTAADPRSVPDLLGDLVQQSSSLVRQEVQLARAEMGEKVSQLGTAAASIGVAGALLLGALIILLQAVVALLVSFGLQAWVAGLIVGVVVALIGYLLLQGALTKMKAANLTPERTVNQVSKDATVAKEAVR
ncbi:phage holin family protein [Roseomonas haemaphysalidis]|uniref:Phage holin family protein n=1 Tax=Roseomonas haemaphysalidis TaxID=2768162 RepID=A0ABS3KNM6_9PROT|nr:phage holin family protein [Roseomonas haemaphysalidis]MBO1079063.1 phage holin family protein [Roseomonas haemaphysalidis]